MSLIQLYHNILLFNTLNMKNLALLLLSFIAIHVYAQDAVDIGTPASSPFNLGGDIQGTIQNSVNEVTGKVTFSVPLASIASASASFGLSLTYNGQAAFKNGQETNKYNPTSTVGVGWSLGVPKIVVDNKNTGTRDDDVFYLLDGATNTKLICIDRGTTVNGSVWEFQMEKYAPWKIYFYYHSTWGDYWKIVNDSGLTFYYGNPSSNVARDHVVRYGNWIGSSKQSGASGQQAIQWSLYKIEDQWNNYLVFEYDYVTQTMSGYAQTEASYLKKVISSKGASIQLTYGYKDIYEYYEPHQEGSEPDAYQERYEKKYLQSVSSYNNANQLISTYNLGYTLDGINYNKKRYLTSLTQTSYNNGLNETLPVQTFEYHYTGTYKGGIKKITYPTGGSVTYNYNNKLLFNNYANLHETAFTPPSGYMYYSSFVSDNYGLYVYRTQNTVSGGKHQFKIYRFWWNGQKWENNEFTFPYLLNDDYPNAGDRMKDFYVVLENDFYGFAYDNGTTANMYLFHMAKDGHSWIYKSYSNINIGGSTEEPPVFMSGDGFVALAAKRSGMLYTYVWNGENWNYKLINQGTGTFYLAAANNYIISLDEDGHNNGDMITGYDHTDYYYIHYLDVEKQWHTKSWSLAADPYIGDVKSASYFYPDNSLIGFVAANNSEMFLRWDIDYNLTNVDNVLGSYDDRYPLVPVANSMFTIHNYWYKHPLKSARFNGVSWSWSSLPSSSAYYSKLNFGKDILFFQNHPSISGIGYHRYNPNTNSWSYSSLNSGYSSSLQNYKLSITNRDFTIASNKIYEMTPQGLFNQIGSLQNDNTFAYTDGLSHAFVRENDPSTGSYIKGSYFYISKVTGLLENINLGLKYLLASATDKIGGYTPFMSPNAIWLGNAYSPTSGYFYRIIDDKVNNSVYDIVVDYIDIDDDNGNLRKVQYTYNNANCAPDNSSTFYGEVIVENKGFGSGNIGKVTKLFNDGSVDIQMVGLPLEAQVYDNNNNLIKKSTTTWQKNEISLWNGSLTVDKAYYIRATNQKEELYFNGNPTLVTQTNNLYDSKGLLTYSTTTNSKGVTQTKDIIFAYEQYAFVNDKNMLSFPYQITNFNGTQSINVEQSKWVSDNGKVYINENWSGTSTSSLRLNHKISKVESTTTGNVLESNNGKGIYNTVLFGYDNLYEVATISNAKYQDVVNQLDVTYAQLQNLTTASLKVELLKLYDRIPTAAINLTFYDSNGRVVSSINERKEESFVYYDTSGRLDYVADGQGHILEKKEYHFAN